MDIGLLTKATFQALKPVCQHVMQAASILLQGGRFAVRVEQLCAPLLLLQRELACAIDADALDANAALIQVAIYRQGLPRCIDYVLLPLLLMLSPGEDGAGTAGAPSASDVTVQAVPDRLHECIWATIHALITAAGPSAFCTDPAAAAAASSAGAAAGAGQGQGQGHGQPAGIAPATQTGTGAEAETPQPRIHDVLARAIATLREGASGPGPVAGQSFRQGTATGPGPAPGAGMALTPEAGPSEETMAACMAVVRDVCAHAGGLLGPRGSNSDGDGGTVALAQEQTSGQATPVQSPETAESDRDGDDGGMRAGDTSAAVSAVGSAGSGDTALWAALRSCATGHWPAPRGSPYEEACPPPFGDTRHLGPPGSDGPSVSSGVLTATAGSAWLADLVSVLLTIATADPLGPLGRGAGARAAAVDSASPLASRPANATLLGSSVLEAQGLGGSASGTGAGSVGNRPRFGRWTRIQALATLGCLVAATGRLPTSLTTPGDASSSGRGTQLSSAAAVAAMPGPARLAPVFPGLVTSLLALAAPQALSSPQGRDSQVRSKATGVLALVLTVVMGQGQGRSAAVRTTATASAKSITRQAHARLMLQALLPPPSWLAAAAPRVQEVLEALAGHSLALVPVESMGVAGTAAVPVGPGEPVATTGIHGLAVAQTLALRDSVNDATAPPGHPLGGREWSSHVHLWSAVLHMCFGAGRADATASTAAPAGGQAQAGSGAGGSHAAAPLAGTSPAALACDMVHLLAGGAGDGIGAPLTDSRGGLLPTADNTSNGRVHELTHALATVHLARLPLVLAAVSGTGTGGSDGAQARSGNGLAGAGASRTTATGSSDWTRAVQALSDPAWLTTHAKLPVGVHVSSFGLGLPPPLALRLTLAYSGQGGLAGQGQDEQSVVAESSLLLAAAGLWHAAATNGSGSIGPTNAVAGKEAVTSSGLGSFLTAIARQRDGLRHTVAGAGNGASGDNSRLQRVVNTAGLAGLPAVLALFQQLELQAARAAQHEGKPNMGLGTGSAADTDRDTSTTALAALASLEAIVQALMTGHVRWGTTGDSTTGGSITSTGVGVDGPRANVWPGSAWGARAVFGSRGDASDGQGRSPERAVQLLLDACLGHGGNSTGQAEFRPAAQPQPLWLCALAVAALGTVHHEAAASVLAAAQSARDLAGQGKGSFDRASSTTRVMGSSDTTTAQARFRTCTADVKSTGAALAQAVQRLVPVGLGALSGQFLPTAAAAACRLLSVCAIACGQAVEGLVPSLLPPLLAASMGHAGATSDSSGTAGRSAIGTGSATETVALWTGSTALVVAAGAPADTSAVLSQAATAALECIGLACGHRQDHAAVAGKAMGSTTSGQSSTAGTDKVATAAARFIPLPRPVNAVGTPAGAGPAYAAGAVPVQHTGLPPETKTTAPQAAIVPAFVPGAIPAAGQAPGSQAVTIARRAQGQVHSLGPLSGHGHGQDQLSSLGPAAQALLVHHTSALGDAVVRELRGLAEAGLSMGPGLSMGSGVGTAQDGPLSLLPWGGGLVLPGETADRSAVATLASNSAARTAAALDVTRLSSVPNLVSSLVSAALASHQQTVDLVRSGQLQPQASGPALPLLQDTTSALLLAVEALSGTTAVVGVDAGAASTGMLTAQPADVTRIGAGASLNGGNPAAKRKAMAGARTLLAARLLESAAQVVSAAAVVGASVPVGQAALVRQQFVAADSTGGAGVGAGGDRLPSVPPSEVSYSPSPGYDHAIAVAGPTTMGMAAPGVPSTAGPASSLSPALARLLHKSRELQGITSGSGFTASSLSGSGAQGTTQPGGSSPQHSSRPARPSRAAVDPEATRLALASVPYLSPPALILAVRVVRMAAVHISAAAADFRRDYGDATGAGAATIGSTGSGGDGNDSQARLRRLQLTRAALLAYLSGVIALTRHPDTLHPLVADTWPALLALLPPTGAVRLLPGTLGQASPHALAVALAQALSNGGSGGQGAQGSGIGTASRALVPVTGIISGTGSSNSGATGAAAWGSVLSQDPRQAAAWLEGSGTAGGRGQSAASGLGLRPVSANGNGSQPLALSPSSTVPQPGLAMAASSSTSLALQQSLVDRARTFMQRRAAALTGTATGGGGNAVTGATAAGQGSQRRALPGPERTVMRLGLAGPEPVDGSDDEGDGRSAATGALVRPMHSGAAGTTTGSNNRVLALAADTSQSEGLSTLTTIVHALAVQVVCVLARAPMLVQQPSAQAGQRPPSPTQSINSPAATAASTIITLPGACCGDVIRSRFSGELWPRLRAVLMAAVLEARCGDREGGQGKYSGRGGHGDYDNDDDDAGVADHGLASSSSSSLAGLLPRHRLYLAVLHSLVTCFARPTVVLGRTGDVDAGAAAQDAAGRNSDPLSDRGPSVPGSTKGRGLLKPPPLHEDGPGGSGSGGGKGKGRKGKRFGLPSAGAGHASVPFGSDVPGTAHVAYGSEAGADDDDEDDDEGQDGTSGEDSSRTSFSIEGPLLGPHAWDASVLCAAVCGEKWHAGHGPTTTATASDPPSSAPHAAASVRTAMADSLPSAVSRAARQALLAIGTWLDGHAANAARGQMGRG